MLLAFQHTYMYASVWFLVECRYLPVARYRYVSVEARYDALILLPVIKLH